MANRDPDCPQAGPRGGRLNDGFKQRIVGALVLAALAVIFLPTLFDREGARYIDVTSQIPPTPDIQPIEIAAPEPVADVAPAPDPEQAFQPEVEKEDPKPQPPVRKPDAETGEWESKDPEQTQNQKQNSPLVDQRGLPVAWVVQVASYREASRAEQLRGRLMDEGFKAFTREVTTDKGRFVRVFVGPKVNKAEAQAAKRELDQLLKAQTLVLRFKA
ncbi:SPOR domain-containing protein [Microbulbifer thermotolerans]|uniref:SPOR domain-containing protein n=1 Tax=Microbulbifer thermotolerans TaxID=252514 RepID=A0AB35HXP6_MICTH|nr:SPOR domain-containing protein [Microbulbifer thermotolerans]MCX2778891.1 SPOR domain-containing protein [Microbulbifer thermotolerans]MCX2800960.1 SPOR domain-containing protein [Microbulbifer thermotolerans]MCX2804196.1 SPOR domain-containing protein [Microbulbifer thermotolerans]WKT61710.1 SPOR domain-containing protein [Microbulbifer thermotolerans]